MSKDKQKSYAIRGMVIVVVTLVVMLGIGLISNIITNSFINNNEGNTMNAQFGNIMIEEIKTSEVHYIDQSLIGVALSIPYEITPNDATNQDIYVVSDDNSIIKVNDDNTITALSTGKVTLTLVANDGSNVTASLEIVVE